MDGLVYLLNLAGEALARAQREMADLRAENERLRQALAEQAASTT